MSVDFKNKQMSRDGLELIIQKKWGNNSFFWENYWLFKYQIKYYAVEKIRKNQSLYFLKVSSI